MSLKIREMKLADFDTIKTYTDANGGSLASPLLLDVWPVHSPLDSQRRSTWSAEQDRWRFLNDKSARFAACVDEKIEEIVALARWHYYPDGYPIEDAWMEADATFGPEVMDLDKGVDAEKHNFPDGLQWENMIQFIKMATTQRTEWEVSKGPCWILTTLVTRTAHRRRGAGGMLVDWGTEQASAMKLLACLEADPDATSMYRKHGFLEYDVVKVENTSEGDDFSLVRMYKKP